MLFQQARHTPLKTAPWSEEIVKNVIEDIFNWAIKNYDSKKGWKAHPDEDSAIEYNKSLYFGAAGVLWGLHQIEKTFGFQSGFDFKELIAKVHKDYLDQPDTESVVPSFSLGETGIVLLRYIWTGDIELLDHLERLIESNIRNPVNEALWGSPGSMLAPLFLYRKEKSERWKKLFLKNCEYLFETWNYKIGETRVWQQDLYGKQRRIVGAGHGFIGNIHPMIDGADLLTEEQRKILFDRTVVVLSQHVQIDGEMANWPYLFDEDSERGILVQWCHGSPGVITSLKNFPKNYSAKLESLLEMGGETVWQAGPLNKGVGICHSTDGNGWAFLTLYNRTGNQKWLERARAFAMHAISQRNGRFSLWTGEMGLATFLMACMTLDERIPTLDRME